MGGILLAGRPRPLLVTSIVLGGHGYGHGHPHGAAWLILVVILGFAFLRLARLADRR